VRPLITEKDVQRTIIDRFGLLEQQIGIVLIDFANDEGRHHLVDRIEA
jgi:hypothetical protein